MAEYSERTQLGRQVGDMGNTFAKRLMHLNVSCFAASGPLFIKIDFRGIHYHHFILTLIKFKWYEGIGHKLL